SPNGLISTLALVSKFFDDKVCIEAFQGKGLQIRAIDQAKCSFVDAFFPAVVDPGQTPIFSRFDCDRPYFPMWVAPALLGKSIRTALDARRRQTSGSAAYLLHLSVAAADPDRLVLAGETVAVPGQRAAGVIKSTRQDLALLTPT
ncbi:hypothetical protein Agub_g8966, partial [Astrephomene gubernaculifera]